MNIKSALAWGTGLLTSGTKRLDAEVLLAHVLKKSREYLAGNPEADLGDTQQKLYKKIVQKRREGEPVAYLTGEKEFFGLKITVNKNCLIPRPETEMLVIEAIRLAKNYKNPRICDVGTGSGAIAIALARHVAGARVTATDISKKALDLARKNAQAHDEDITFIQCDLLPDGRFDIVVANLPYLRADDTGISEKTRKYEPHLALFGGGQDGLSLYKKLFGDIEGRTSKPDCVLGEFGQGQEETIKTMLPDAEIKNDLAGIPRLFIWQFCRPGLTIQKDERKTPKTDCRT